MKQITTWIRDNLPKRFQVPVKYWMNARARLLEEEMKFLSKIVNPRELAIDIGGNRGIYTYRLWQLGAKVEVFEPNPYCASVLEVWSVRRKPSVNVHCVALSDAPGTANLHIPVDEQGVEHDSSASLEHDDLSGVRDQLVNLRTLDSFAFENVGFIKIDVEGHEFNVISGAKQILDSSKPALLVEIEQRHCNRPIGEVFDKIEGHGYRGFYLDRSGTLISLDNFSVDRDQNSDNFGNSSKSYINNFLFLHETRMSEHKYDSLLREFSYR
ncbi:FkbM family methyltransferase [Solemya elarraichensis gill symbiont]|uniref:Methyltransferase FkbM domain-containing protein n=1 Tax=Solemya elarraichensis gill symbiont TaxID=1918949 RepID=A0A1T2L789_9GAMM|nr:FkbM family methyltransferase [Solemya elarraichensis gill symbiont]OOZ40922.1 hypothetical protein BOW52_05220 [Solemya elarraichensis gill symbiont]